MKDLYYSASTPETDEYIDLRVAAGLSRKSPEAAEAGLQGTCVGVTVRDGERLVGMGRVIGDGGCFYQVVDIAVHPDYQRQGIGYEIMDRLMGAFRRIAPETAYVSLIADGEAHRLYEKFGFEPTAPASIGMGLRL